MIDPNKPRPPKFHETFEDVSSYKPEAPKTSAVTKKKPDAQSASTAAPMGDTAPSNGAAPAIKRKPVPNSASTPAPSNDAPLKIKRKPVANSASTSASLTDTVEQKSVSTSAKETGLQTPRPSTTSARQITKPKSASISNSFIENGAVHGDKNAWQAAQGPIASKQQVETFLNEAAQLAPLAQQAKSRARINKWASVAVGAAVGIAVGVGVSMGAGPVAGIAAGAVAGAASFAILKYLLLKNPASQTLKQSEASFHANLGATIRAAHADPALARMLDNDKRWQDAVKPLNGHYPGRPIHASLAREFDPALRVAGDEPQMWAEVEPSRFDRD
jgi:hypothetical protein